MLAYQPKIQKFSEQEGSAQWQADFISEIEGPGGPGKQLKHVYFGQCLKDAAYEWYCHKLKYK
jgi:hypothetical protein